MCVCATAPACGICCVGLDFSSWKPIIRQHWVLVRKDEVSSGSRVLFSQTMRSFRGLITEVTPPLDFDDTFPVIRGHDQYRL